MSIVQRDYIERMIEQAAQAIAQVLQLVRTGDLDPAMILLQKTRDLVLGPMRPVLERVDAAGAVELVGKYEMDRLRLYAATSLAGARLKPADCERIALLQPQVAPGSIGKRFGDELQRLASEASP